MKDRVYLDHAATTPTDEGVLQEMLPYFHDVFGNASSLHRSGRRAVAAVDEARERVARAIGATASEIFFTSGGTESDNWAIEGVALAAPEGKGHILSTMIEHPAVLETLRRLETMGYDVTYLPVDSRGFVSVRDAVEAMREDTLLVSVMYANNEVGSIQPIREIAREAHARGILVHTDAVQAVGSLPVDVREADVDLLSLSAHKFYGPKGVGALYVRKGTHIKGLLLGGEQEHSLRGGTYNTPAIVGLGAAIERATQSLAENAKRISSLKDRFLRGIAERFPTASINGGEPSHPGIVNLRFAGVRNSELLSALDLAGIEVSLGSACSSGSVEPSHVLTAMGCTKEDVQSSLRFSFGRENDEADADRALDALSDILKRLETHDLFLQKEEKKYDM